MKIDINKDFEKAFPDDLWKGFTLKQIITFSVGLIMAAGTIIALWVFLKISPVTGSYIAIPVMLPICFIGIYEYQNHSLWAMYKEMRFYRATKKLSYGAEEAPKTGRIFTMHQKRKREKRNNKMTEPENKVSGSFRLKEE